MKEKATMMSVMLIDTEILEFRSGDLFGFDSPFDAENMQKLKQSVSYKSQLYFDALKNIH